MTQQTNILKGQTEKWASNHAFFPSQNDKLSVINNSFETVKTKLWAHDFNHVFPANSASKMFAWQQFSPSTSALFSLFRPKWVLSQLIHKSTWKGKPWLKSSLKKQLDQQLSGKWPTIVLQKTSFLLTLMGGFLHALSEFVTLTRIVNVNSHAMKRKVSGSTVPVVFWTLPVFVSKLTSWVE